MKNPDKDITSSDRFISELVEQELSGKNIQSTYRLVKDLASWDNPGPLQEILNVPLEAFGEKGILSLEFLDKSAHNPNMSNIWIDFKWKLAAFHEIRDIFDSPMYLGGTPENIFQIWYFYYESCSLLKEVILAGFNGMYSASSAVLRVFFEFSILQLYFYKACDNAKSYDPLENYFKHGRKPSWNTLLNKAVPNDTFCKPIKVLLDAHMKGLSNSASHPYHPDHSPRHHSTTPGNVSLEGLYFWFSTRLVLHTVLWAYYVNFPMLFHPRNKLAKFGFNGPVGLFVDEQCTTSVKRSLGGEEFEHFLSYTSSNEDVKAMIDWYDSFPLLTEEEIRRTWSNDEKLGDIGDNLDAAICKQKAMMRAMSEITALRFREDESTNEELDQIFDSLSYPKWKELYKNIGKKAS